MVNLLCAGNVPPSVVPHLCGALLLPCLKKSGGLHPIAIGEVLCHLTSKYAAREVLPEAICILSLSKWVLVFLVAAKPSFTLFLMFSRITPSHLNTSNFSLALHPIVRKIKEQVPGLVINAWYIDDGTLCGSPADLARALSIIESKQSQISHLHPFHLYLTLLFVIFAPLLKGSPSWVPQLAPPPTFCESSVPDRVDKIISNLSDLQDAQMESSLL